MIDPLARWRRHGEKPDFAGLLSFGGAPYTEDAADLRGVDVAIVGAPMDDLVSDRPGTRMGPRAIRASSCPPGPHLAAGIDAFAALRIVDYGDAPVTPASPQASHEAITATLAEVLAAGALPVLLGGDHSITEPAVRAVAAHHGGPVGLLHLDAHTDTGEEVFGAELSHGTPMRRLVDQGLVDPARYVQIGLRGYWPGEDIFAWQRERGIRDVRMHEVEDRGIDAVVDEAVAHLAPGGPVYLSFDIDVVDPAFAPGTGTPEPGGLTAADALRAIRRAAAGLDLAGADVVEVQDERVTALLAERLVRELLTGIALRRA